MKIIRLLAVMELLFLFVSCNTESYNVELIERDTSKTIDPAISFVMQDSIQPYSIKIHTETSTEMNIEDKDMKMTSNAEVDLAVVVKKDTPGSRTIRLTIRHIQLKRTMNDDETVSSSDSSDPYNPVSLMLNGIKGGTLIVRIDADKKMTMIQGLEPVVEKAMKTAGFTDAAALRAIQKQMKDLLGEGLLNGVMNNDGILPDKTIAVGDEWKKEHTGTLGLNIPFETEYVLAALEGNKATIYSKTPMVLDGQKLASGMMADIADATAYLKGEQIGELLFDLRTGVVFMSNNTTEMKGEVDMLGRKIPVKIQNTKKIVTTQ